MSLFQCAKCGCCENTATSNYIQYAMKKEAPVCSACDGGRKGIGWHGVFTRRFLPKGKFFTNGQGNLEHKETGETDYTKYELPTEDKP